MGEINIINDDLRREISANEICKAVANVIKYMNNKKPLSADMIDLFTVFGASIIGELFNDEEV